MKVAILLLALLPAPIPAQWSRVQWSRVQWSMKRQTAPPAKQSAGTLTPAEQKRLADAIGRLTPKQRKQLAKAMKKMTPAQQNQVAGALQAQIARGR